MWLQNEEVIFFLPAERQVLQESLQTGILRLLPSGAPGGVGSGELWRKPPRTEIATHGPPRLAPYNNWMQQGISEPPKHGFNGITWR